MEKLVLALCLFVSISFGDTGLQNATASDVVNGVFYMAVIVGISYLIWGVIWGVFDKKKDKNDK
ncbi:hypothetical protein [Helicobacter sp. 23-1045]